MGRRGGGPVGPTPPGAQQRWGRRGLGLGWARGVEGGGHCAGRPHPGLLPRGGGRVPHPSPSRWRRKGSAGSGQLCAFLLYPSLAPSPPPTILLTISGEAGLVFSGRPFLSLHLGGRGPEDTSSLPPSSGNSPERVLAPVSFPFPSRAALTPKTPFHESGGLLLLHRKGVL